MHFHVIQHVPFENLAALEPWLETQGYSFSYYRQFAGDALPDVDNCEALIVLGGPMGIYDEAEFPWLVAEKALIKGVIAAEKPVLGLCLGAQLIADALGAKVTRNQETEIGWFEIHKTASLSRDWYQQLPNEFTVFHWHGDTFAIPEGAQALFASQACRNQGFVYAQHVLALQCHPEATAESVAAIVEHAADEIVAAPYVQSAETLQNELGHYAGMYEALVIMLNAWSRKQL